MGRDTWSLEATVVAEELKDPEAIWRALLPESGRAKRFESKVKRENGRVIIEIRAADPTALRAAINSYLRLLILLGDVEERL